ncbi:MAG: hypothetical protein ABI696_12390 [Rubrivivax sp.]
MRRLIAIALILWLPLQAWSAVFAAGCMGHGSAQHVAAADATPQRLHDHAGTASAVVTSESAQANGARSTGDAHAANNVACAVGVDCCVTACTVFLHVATSAMAAANAATAPARHGDEVFSSAPANQALEPPIAAA